MLEGERLAVAHTHLLYYTSSIGSIGIGPSVLVNDSRARGHTIAAAT